MSTPSDIIASQAKNCSFTLQSIQKLLSLMETQQIEYSNISYKANGPLALVLKSKKNGVEDVALKVLECTDQAAYQIQAMEREYAIWKQLPSCDYFMTVQSQFYLIETDESTEQDQSGNLNTARKVFFVQQMELCQGSLHDIIQNYSEKNKDPPSEAFKELLAIQMLDAVNLLHQKHIVHGKITIQNFLVSSQDYPFLLKLCNLKFTSTDNLRNPIAEIFKDCFEQDLVSLGKVFLQLDSIGTKFDCLSSSISEIAQPELTTMSETHQLNPSTFLSKIAYSLLSKKSKENSQNARSILLLLLQKQAESLKIPLFSIVLKSHLDSLSLPIPSKRIRLDFLVWQISRQNKLHKIASQFDANGQMKTDLTIRLIKSALNVMLEWEEFSGHFDVLGVGVGGVIFGVENLKQKRKSALKFSLCTNKAEIIREIGLMRICQAPFIIKFYQHKFFKDANGNEFVVYELERCKYSLIHHLELQRITGEYSDEQKNSLALQILDSVSFLHKNRILHRNLKIDSFLISEDISGQVVIKLGNFRHAIQLQDHFEEEQTLEQQLLQREYKSPINCILKRNSKESPLYFAPERWETPDLSTYLTDSFSVGLCLLFIDNWLVCSEEQLAQNLLSSSLGPLKFCLNIYLQISQKNGFKRITKQLLMFQPDQRISIKNLTEKTIGSFQEHQISMDQQDVNIIQQQIIPNVEDSKVIEEFKKVSIIFSSPDSVSLNLNKMLIPQIEVKSALKLISNLTNLSNISIDFNRSSIKHFGAKSLLSLLGKFSKLSRVSLNLQENAIEDIEAKYLLSPLANLLDLSSLNLHLQQNNIGELGAQSLLSPLANLLNLSSLNLNLYDNKIKDLGAESLLNPLTNLLNLQSLHLKLHGNIIGELGAQSLLSPIANNLNLSSLTLDLYHNTIGDLGAESLLSPLANLVNLLNLNLDLGLNKIRDLGAKSLLSPLANLPNLSSLNLDLNFNTIGDLGAESLLSPLANLFNLSSLNLDLQDNTIGDLGAQSLLSPLANNLNLSSLNLDLQYNKIEELGAQSLLSPLANLLNLTCLNLDLQYNTIGDLGAESLLSPLANLINLSSLNLKLKDNTIGELGAESLLSPLANLTNFSSLNLNIDDNKIGDLGAQSLLSPLTDLLTLSKITFICQSNNIHDIGAYFLFQSFSQLVNLSSLDSELNNNLLTKKIKHLFFYYFNKLKTFQMSD